MSTDPDTELGAALRRLPTPDHGPGFWDDLEQRLAAEAPVDELSRRRARRFGAGPWLLSAAAAVALVGDGGGRRERRGPHAGEGSQ